MVELVKHADVKDKLLNSPEARKAYEEAVDEIRAIRLMTQIRKAARVTQEEIAAKMGTQKSNISRLENGKTDPRLSTLFSYARAQGVEIELTVK
jgi:DNA-binding XRE family transcriptional regulator